MNRTTARRGVLTARIGMLSVLLLIVTMILAACMPQSRFASDLAISRYVVVQVEGTPVGSGVIYDRYNVITNSHVANYVNRIIAMRAKEGKTTEVTLRQGDKVYGGTVGMIRDTGKGEADLALIKTNIGEDIMPLQVRSDPLPLRTPVMIATSIVVTPFTLLLDATVANAGTSDWAYLAQVLVWPGMSGSPVFDENGRLVGLVYAMYFGTHTTFGERHNAGIAGIVQGDDIVAFLIAAGVLSPVQSPTDGPVA